MLNAVTNGKNRYFFTELSFGLVLYAPSEALIRELRSQIERRGGRLVETTREQYVEAGFEATALQLNTNKNTSG